MTLYTTWCDSAREKKKPQDADNGITEAFEYGEADGTRTHNLRIDSPML